jgi:hypothetical protein
MQIFWRINSLFDKNFSSMLYFNRLVNTVVEPLMKLGQMTGYDTTKLPVPSCSLSICNVCSSFQMHMGYSHR